MTPAEKTAKRLAGIAREQVESPFQEATGHHGTALLIFTVTRWGWLLKWMETSMIYNRTKMRDARRFERDGVADCPLWE